MKCLNILIAISVFLMLPCLARSDWWEESIILSCESLHEDAQKLRAEFQNRFLEEKSKRFEVLSLRQLRFEKAKPPKQIIEEYNPRCVYCWSYHEDIKSNWDDGTSRTSRDTYNRIVIVLQSGSIKIRDWDNFMYISDTKGFAPDEAARKKARERFKKLWDTTCPYQPIKEKD